MSEEKQTRKTRAEAMVEELEKKVEKLEACFAKVCHMSGTEKLLREYGIDTWTPGKNDMRKFKD